MGVLSFLIEMCQIKKSMKADLSSTTSLVNKGEFWDFCGLNRSPWPREDLKTRVEILDVKNGWVRYYMNRTFQDERMETSIFVMLYKKSEE